MTVLVPNEKAISAIEVYETVWLQMLADDIMSFRTLLSYWNDIEKAQGVPRLLSVVSPEGEFLNRPSGDDLEEFELEPF